MRHGLTAFKNLRLEQFTQIYMRNEIYPSVWSHFIYLWVLSYANRYGNVQYYNLIFTFNDKIFSFLFPREMINKQTKPFFFFLMS